MTHSPRTTHQRDQRFARVRLVTRSIFVGSGVLSVGLVGYLSSVTKLPPATHPSTTLAPTTTAPIATGATGATGAPTTTTVPITTTTTCYTSPSGNTMCN